MEAIDVKRQCLFCQAVAPAEIPTEAMILRKSKANQGWYSNGLTYNPTAELARFYLCPEHRHRTKEAWDWAREGFQAL